MEGNLSELPRVLEGHGRGATLMFSQVSKWLALWVKPLCAKVNPT